MSDDTSRRQEIQQQHWSRDKSSRRRPEHPVVRAAFEPLAEIVASMDTDPAKASVIDVGCGNGFLQWALEQRFGHVVGVDFSEEMLRINPCREKLLGSATALPFEDGSFDVAVGAHLLHHLVEADRVRAVEEMKRVARRGVISFEPNRNNPLMFAFALVKPEERMALEFTRSYMERLFTGAGLTAVDVHVEGWIVPNKAPTWWVPIGQAIQKTPLGRAGVDICAVGRMS